MVYEDVWNVCDLEAGINGTHQLVLRDTSALHEAEFNDNTDLRIEISAADFNAVVAGGDSPIITWVEDDSDSDKADHYEITDTSAKSLAGKVSKVTKGEGLVNEVIATLNGYREDLAQATGFTGKMVTLMRMTSIMLIVVS